MECRRAVVEIISSSRTPRQLTGVPTRDRNDVTLVSAYGRAYRALRSNRHLAGVGEAVDAMAVPRSFVPPVLRSLYLVRPDDPEERHEWGGRLPHDQDIATMLNIAASLHERVPEDV